MWRGGGDGREMAPLSLRVGTFFPFMPSRRLHTKKKGFTFTSGLGIPGSDWCQGGDVSSLRFFWDCGEN